MVHNLIQLYRFTVQTAFTCLLLAAPIFGNAETINTNHETSQISFAGEHAGMPFSGKFRSWQAQLILPPSNTPKIEASIDLRSAKTGDRTYDETLTEGDWFDVKNTPKGQFFSQDIQLTDKGFLVKGELTLRGITQTLEFTLTHTSKGLTGQLKIDRLAFDIGKDSDPDAEWVSRYITLNLHITR